MNTKCYDFQNSNSKVKVHLDVYNYTNLKEKSFYNFKLISINQP